MIHGTFINDKADIYYCVDSPDVSSIMKSKMKKPSQN